MKAWRSIDAVTVEQRHGRHAQLCAHSRQFLGQGGAFEKAESGAGMELDVHWANYTISQFPNYSIVGSLHKPLPAAGVAIQAVEGGTGFVL